MPDQSSVIARAYDLAYSGSFARLSELAVSLSAEGLEGGRIFTLPTALRRDLQIVCHRASTFRTPRKLDALKAEARFDEKVKKLVKHKPAQEKSE